MQMLQSYIYRQWRIQTSLGVGAPKDWVGGPLGPLLKIWQWVLLLIILLVNN